MGISVSESNATKEMDQRARTRRDGQKDQIRSELAAGPLESHQKNHSARKSKTEKGTPLRPILNALSDSRQIDPIWEERGSGQLRQDAVDSNVHRGEVTKNQNEGQSSQRQSSIQCERVVGNEGNITFATPRKMEVAAVEEELPETVTKMVLIGGAKNRTEGVEREEDLVEATGKREEDLDEITVKKGTRAHVVIESYQKQQTFERTESFSKKARKESLNIPLITVNQPQDKGFESFDWTIPGDEGVSSQMSRRYQMPSMNFILSSKLSENLRGIEEEEGSSKNRRHLMRDLLSGRRQHIDDHFRLPSCGDLKKVC